METIEKKETEEFAESTEKVEETSSSSTQLSSDSERYSEDSEEDSSSSDSSDESQSLEYSDSSNIESSDDEETSPQAVVLNFTTNEEMDLLALDDENIEIVGYVDDIQYDASSEPDFKRYRFYKIVVNNGYGKRVQVTGWNERSAKIFQIDRLYTLVHLKNLKALPIVDKIYNLGNVDFELIVQNNTESTTYGKYDVPEVNLCSILDATNKPGSQVRIECYIKSPLKKCKTSESKLKSEETYIQGSITDGVYMMNVRLPTQVEELKLKVGQAVSVIGEVLDEDAKPAKLYVENLRDVQKIPDRPDIPIELAHLGNKYPKRVVA